jgi:tetraacyldisaccharide 4'-kinase
MNFLKVILYPLIPVYAFIIWLRNFLFDKNIFKSRSVNAKVFSVGNITFGGSGKTPVTIYLTNLLKSGGYKVGVLSRGYGRKSTGYVLVYDGRKFKSTVEKSGDEIYHTVLDCSVPAAVSENRVKGAERLISDTGVNTIVLDDAFQHRWIKRDVDILVIDQRFLSEKSFFTHNLLPTGVMREPFTSVKRADAVIINRKFMEKKEIPVELKNILMEKIFTGFIKHSSF